MELIVGDRTIPSRALFRVAHGIEAFLSGSAVLPVLDAAFHATARIEVRGCDLDDRLLEVSGIEMQGAETRVTLIYRESGKHH